jgi:hypothetical protein
MRAGAVALIAVSVALAVPAAAPARLRTGRAVVTEQRNVTPVFPGLETVSVSYDDQSGALGLTATLRSPLPARGLHYTDLSFYLGAFYGDEIAPGICQFLFGVASARVPLDGDQAWVEIDPPVTGPANTEAPVAVSPDRRTVSVQFGADGALAHRNPVCLAANLLDRDDETFSEWANGMLDGFTPADGDIGAYAADSLGDQLTELYNAYAADPEEVFTVPGARARCTPARGDIRVSCTASARLRAVAGAPKVTLKGSRTFRLVAVRGGDVLRWRQALAVTVRWPRCPAAVNASRARAHRVCEATLNWRRGALAGAFHKRFPRLRRR